MMIIERVVSFLWGMLCGSGVTGGIKRIADGEVNRGVITLLIALVVAIISLTRDPREERW